MGDRKWERRGQGGVKDALQYKTLIFETEKGGPEPHNKVQGGLKEVSRRSQGRKEGSRKGQGTSVGKSIPLEQPFIKQKSFKNNQTGS